MNLRRRVADRLWVVFAIAALLFAITPLISIIYFVVVNGLSTINWNFLTSNPTPTGDGGGIGNAIEGSFIVVLLASAIGIPIGIVSGVYVSEFGNGGYGQTIRFLADVLAGIPSIVTGIFIYALIVVTLQHFSAFAGGVALGFMMIPIVSNTTSEALKLVPNSLREASMALGVRKWRTTFVVISNARGGIVTGILLAIARAAGETAPLILTALGSQLGFSGFFQPIASLTVSIFQNATSGTPVLVSQAYGASFVLLVTVLGINILVKFFTRSKFRVVQ